MKQVNQNQHPSSHLSPKTTVVLQESNFNLLKHKGYTLVELMVVVTTLGILLSAAIPAYSSFTRSSREMQATTRVQKIAMKLEHYYNKTMSYQTDLSGLDIPQHDSWFQYRIESANRRQYRIIASPLPGSSSRKEFSLNQHGHQQHRVPGDIDWSHGWS